MLHLFKVQGIVINAFNTVKILILGNTIPIHVTETSREVPNYPVDKKYRMLLNQGVYSRVRTEPRLGHLPSQLSVFQILNL
jgi:ABC-type lipoprotein release transport system permease subunit